MTLDLASIFASIIAGFLSILSPCILPILPIILLGSHKDDKTRPLFIIFGLSITFVALGILSVVFSSILVGKIQILEKISAFIILFFGMALMFDYNLFKRVTFFSSIKTNYTGKFAPILLGMSLGLIWIPCTGPVLSSILLLAASKSDFTIGVILLSLYSIGFSIPLIAIAYFSQFFRSKISGLMKYPNIIRYVSGIILVLLSLYIMVFGMVLL
jgi:cytochrome c-type biogenesis protein